MNSSPPLTSVNWRERLLFSEHHLSHAASAYYPSPFNSAAVLTLDGVGEWTTTSLLWKRERFKSSEGNTLSSLARPLTLRSHFIRVLR